MLEEDDEVRAPGEEEYDIDEEGEEDNQAVMISDDRTSKSDNDFAALNNGNNDFIQLRQDLDRGPQSRKGFRI